MCVRPTNLGTPAAGGELKRRGGLAVLSVGSGHMWRNASRGPRDYPEADQGTAEGGAIIGRSHGGHNGLASGHDNNSAAGGESHRPLQEVGERRGHWRNSTNPASPGGVHHPRPRFGEGEVFFLIFFLFFGVCTKWQPITEEHPDAEQKATRGGWRGVSRGVKSERESRWKRGEKAQCGETERGR